MLEVCQFNREQHRSSRLKDTHGDVTLCRLAPRYLEGGFCLSFEDVALQLLWGPQWRYPTEALVSQLLHIPLRGRKLQVPRTEWPSGADR